MEVCPLKTRKSHSTSPKKPSTTLYVVSSTEAKPKGAADIPSAASKPTPGLSLGERLRAARSEKGFSLETASQNSKVALRYVCMFEEGRYTNGSEERSIAHPRALERRNCQGRLSQPPHDQGSRRQDHAESPRQQPSGEGPSIGALLVEADVSPAARACSTDWIVGAQVLSAKWTASIAPADVDASENHHDGRQKQPHRAPIDQRFGGRGPVDLPKNEQAGEEQDAAAAD